MSAATHKARSPGFSHKGRTAHQVINDPASDEACNGYADGLPLRQHQHILGNQIGAGIEIILHDEQEETRDPGEIGFPFEPDEIIGQLGRSDQIFLHVVKTAAVNFPGFARHSLRQAIAFAQ